MAKIVDFEQDPNAPLGTGNFRDDAGRIMYLHDPDTAGQFIKTMRGAPRLAKNEPVQVDGPPGTPGQAAAAASQAIVSDVGALDAAVTAHEQAPPAPAPAAAPPATPPAAPPGAPAVPPDPVAAAAAVVAPTPVGAPPAGGPGVALVSALGGVTAKLDQRSNPQQAPEPRRYDPTGLPLATVGEGETSNVKEGRSPGAVLEELRDREAFGEAGDRLIRDAYSRQGRTQAKAFETGRDAAMLEYGRNVNTAFEKGAERIAGEKKLATLKAELERNDKSMDPGRYVRNMSTGKLISMMFLAAINGGFGAINKKQNNDVLDAFDNAIERDIQRQKDEIASGRIRTQNDINDLMKKGLDAATAEKVARDNLIGNLAAFKDLEAKRVNALPEQMLQADLLIAPRLEQRAKDRAEILRTAEDEVTRSIRRDQLHARPEPGAAMTPQDMMAMLNYREKITEQQNTKPVEDAVGHPVSIPEAAGIKDDTKQFTQKKAIIDSTRAQLQYLAEKLKLYRGPNGYAGDPDAGKRPFGTSELDEQAREIDRAYALLKRADIMSMTREPSARLQDEFGKITERPFWDTDIPGQLNAINSLLQSAEQQLREGYGEDVGRYYDAVRAGRTARPPAPTGNKPPPAQSPPSPANNPPPATPPGGRDARTGRPRGDLRSE